MEESHVSSRSKCGAVSAPFLPLLQSFELGINVVNRHILRRERAGLLRLEIRRLTFSHVLRLQPRDNSCNAGSPPLPRSNRRQRLRLRPPHGHEPAFLLGEYGLHTHGRFPPAVDGYGVHRNQRRRPPFVRAEEAIDGEDEEHFASRLLGIQHD